MEKKQEADLRSKMLEQLKERAGSYVPEWRFDWEKPDIGTALAFVYSDMMTSVENRYRRMMEKKQIDFLNAAGADLESAKPAKGLVSFGLVNDEVESTKVPTGTIVTAESDQEENGMIPYSTLDDVLVTPAKLQCIYEVNNDADYLGKCYGGEEKIHSPVFVKATQNLQSHELYIGHREVLSGDGETKVTLSFLNHGDIPVKEEILAYLVNEDYAEITYSTEAGFVPFAKACMEDGKIVLYRDKNMPHCTAISINGEENCWIRIVGKQFEAVRYLGFEKVKLAATTENVSLDSVLADNMETDLHECLPFGERLSIYSEAYFTSENLMGKHGATISLSFYLHFAAVPLDTNVESGIQWNWVMREEDFNVQKEYDITVAQVVWEYYNGLGWTRLFADKSQEGIFAAGNKAKGHFVTLNFTCPPDMQRVFVNAGETYAIRARITKLTNPYKMQGNYIVPILNNIAISCDYTGNPVEHVSIQFCNSQIMKKWHGGAVYPYIQPVSEKPSLYFGFHKPLEGGPIKMYCKFNQQINQPEAKLIWEYWDGKRFERLRVIDETENFQKSGIVTFLGANDFKEHTFFGEKYYWLRVTELSQCYQNIMGDMKHSVHIPFLENIIMNTVKIENQGEIKTEYFQVEYYVKKMCIHLHAKNIQHLKLYVLEKVIGALEGEWIEWEQVPDFLESKETSRHYILNRNEGYIQFGDGVAGRVPNASREQTIKVEYQCGGGSHTNVREGEVNRLHRSIGFINQVWNPEPLSGGFDKETPSHAIKRSANHIRMQNRAVTVRDYESLAYASSRRIAKARCFTGIDAEGKTLHGAITLVLLLEDYELGNGMFGIVQSEVESYLKGKMPDSIYYSGKLNFREPEFIHIEVHAVLKVEDYNQAFAVQKDVEERIRQFLDPAKGGFDQDGWEMGCLPNMNQVRNVIHMNGKIEEIQSVFLRAYRAGAKGMEEVDLEQVKAHPFALPTNGVHKISIIY